MRRLIIFILLFIGFSLQGQTCKDSIRNYISNIDTTTRKVFVIAEEMPDLFTDISFFKKISNNINLSELTCCPIYIWYAFVVETDGTLSNIKVCPQFLSCDSIDIEEKDAKNLKKQLTTIFKDIQTNPGKIDGKPVAVAHFSRIHYECMD